MKPINVSIANDRGWTIFNTLIDEEVFDGWRGDPKKPGLEILAARLDDPRFIGRAMIWQEGWYPL